MTNRNSSAGKSRKIIYWIVTIWLSLGMVSTGLVQLFKSKAGQGGADMLAHLGYPGFLLTLLGAWKILGTIAVLLPKFPLLKEWAYAGFFFVMTGALFSHIAVGDAFTKMLPSLLLLLLTFLSWYLRPAGRKMISTTFQWMNNKIPKSISFSRSLQNGKRNTNKCVRLCWIAVWTRT